MWSASHLGAGGGNSSSRSAFGSSSALLTMSSIAGYPSREQLGEDSPAQHQGSYVTLELVGSSTSSCIHVKKKEGTNGGVRLTVSLPRRVHVEAANQTVVQLFEHLDRLTEPVIARVKLTGLRCSPEGAAGLKAFLSMHATTITHVQLKDMLGPFSSAPANTSRRNVHVNTDDSDMQQAEDQEAFSFLAQAFSCCSLESLNLSENTLTAAAWTEWGMHASLQQLILDQVVMDEAAVLQLCTACAFYHSLADLSVVLKSPIGETAVAAVNDFFAACTQLVSLRWLDKSSPSEPINSTSTRASSPSNNSNSSKSRLPWLGVGSLAQTGRGLEQLVLEGGPTLSQQELEEGLLRALKKLPRLTVLKVRGVGLDDAGLKRIVAALLVAKAPLETLDLVGNALQSCQAICDFVAHDHVAPNLRQLALDRNRINVEGARSVMQALAAKGRPDMAVRVENNPFYTGKLAFQLAFEKAEMERERDALLEAQAAAIPPPPPPPLISPVSNDAESDEIKALREQVAQLTADKDSLVKAISVMGATNHVEEQKKLYERIRQLEKKVLPSTPRSSQGTRKSRKPMSRTVSETASPLSASSPGRPSKPHRHSSAMGAFGVTGVSTKSLLSAPTARTPSTPPLARSSRGRASTYDGAESLTPSFLSNASSPALMQQAPRRGQKKASSQRNLQQPPQQASPTLSPPSTTPSTTVSKGRRGGADALNKSLSGGSGNSSNRETSSKRLVGGRGVDKVVEAPSPLTDDTLSSTTEATSIASMEGGTQQQQQQPTSSLENTGPREIEIAGYDFGTGSYPA